MSRLDELSPRGHVALCFDAVEVAQRQQSIDKRRPRKTFAPTAPYWGRCDRDSSHIYTVRDLTSRANQSPDSVRDDIRSL